MDPRITSEADEATKHAKRARKAEERRRRDAERSPDAWERFRILAESLSQARQVVEIADHKARYALVIMGVLNAAVFILFARWDPPAAVFERFGAWLVAAIITYAALSVVFLLHAIDCLRPRWLYHETPSQGAARRGVLYWESILRHDVAELAREWDEIRMAEINAEAVAVSFNLSAVLQKKFRALDRLYTGLTLLVIIAAIGIAGCAYLTFVMSR